MLTKNLDVSKGLVNGARGVVTKFASDSEGKLNDTSCFVSHTFHSIGQDSIPPQKARRFLHLFSFPFNVRNPDYDLFIIPLHATSDIS